jgi:hypothetical protein
VLCTSQDMQDRAVDLVSLLFAVHIAMVVILSITSHVMVSRYRARKPGKRPYKALDTLEDPGKLDVQLVRITSSSGVPPRSGQWGLGPGFDESCMCAKCHIKEDQDCGADCQAARLVNSEIESNFKQERVCARGRK